MYLAVKIFTGKVDSDNTTGSLGDPQLCVLLKQALSFKSDELSDKLKLIVMKNRVVKRGKLLKYQFNSPSWYYRVKKPA